MLFNKYIKKQKFKCIVLPSFQILFPVELHEGSHQ